MRGVVVLLLFAACGKSDVGGRIEWRSLADGEQAARAENRPLLVFVGAEWDTSSKAFEHDTFRDPRVRTYVSRHFVTARSDMTDDELPRTLAERDHLLVVGTPAIIVRTPDGNAEVGLATSFLKPDELVAFLDRCLARLKTGRVVAGRPAPYASRAFDCR